MSRYIEGWRVTNPPGLTNRQIGSCQRQSGANRVAYLMEHPKVAKLVHKKDGTLNRNYHKLVVRWRGKTNPMTGFTNGREIEI